MWNESMIRSFLTLAQSASFSEAARNSHFTQQAISKQIARLEKELDTVLFQRSPRSRSGVRLTPAGEVYYEAFRRAMETIDQARAEVSRLQSEEELRLGYIEMLIFAPDLGDFFQQFRSEYPGIQVQISTFSDSDMLRTLLEDEIDAAIAPDEPENLRPYGLECFPLGDPFPIKICLNRNYFRPGETINREKLRDVKIFMPERGEKLAVERMRDAGLREDNYEFRPNISAALVSVNMLDGGILVGDHCEFRANPDLIFLDTPLFCTGQTCLAWKPDNDKRTLALLVREMRSYVAQRFGPKQ